MHRAYLFPRLLMLLVGLICTSRIAFAGSFDAPVVSAMLAAQQSRPDLTSKLGELAQQYLDSKGMLESLQQRANAGESHVLFVLGAATTTAVSRA